MRAASAGGLSERTAGYAWLILALMVSAHVSESLVRQGLPTLAPFFQPELGLSRTQVGLFMSAMFGGAVLTAIPAGWLVDRWGIRYGLACGLGLVGLSVILAASMQSFAHGLVLLTLTGIGHGSMNPATSRAVIVWFGARQRATAMGLKQTGIPLGGMVAAATLPPLAVVFGWRVALVSAAVAMLVVTALVLLLCREAPRPAGGGAATLASLPALFRHRELWILNGTSLAVAALQTATVTYLTLYFYETRALSAVAAASFVVFANVGGVTGRVVCGIVSDRIFAGQRKPVAQMVLFSTAACLAAIALAAPHLPLPLVALLSFALGFAVMSWTPLGMTLQGEIAGRDAVGAAVGLNSFMSNIGTLIGPPLFGAVVDATGSYQVAWLGMAPVALAVSLAVTLWLRVR